MNDDASPFRVARARESIVLQMSSWRVMGNATTRATTSLKAASMRVLALNSDCNNGVTAPRKTVHETPATTSPFAASNCARDASLAAKVAELNGLIARIARDRRLAEADIAHASEAAITGIDEALHFVRALTVAKTAKTAIGVRRIVPLPLRFPVKHQP